jgi:hypothetical protein
MLGTRPTYRALLAVDIEKSAGRGDVAMLNNREVLRRALREALAEADVPWEECHRTDLGDGFRLVVGRDVPKASLIRPTLPGLAARLRAHNRTTGPRGSIRVRVALHAGDVHMDDGEVVGGSLEALARLLDAPPLRRVLTAAPETATVALAVSRHVYEEVVRHGYPGIDPDTYRQIRFQVKETASTAWIHVPGHTVATSALDDVAEPAIPTPGNRSGGSGAAAPEIVMVAKDHARVKHQIGRVDTWIDQVAGDVQVGATTPAVESLRRQIAEVRRALRREQAAGRLDPATFEAATDEVRAADQYLSTPGGPDRSRLLLALRRLKGLVDDLAGLTTKVAAAISAARDV